MAPKLLALANVCSVLVNFHWHLLIMRVSSGKDEHLSFGFWTKMMPDVVVVAAAPDYTYLIVHCCITTTKKSKLAFLLFPQAFLATYKLVRQKMYAVYKTLFVHCPPPTRHIRLDRTDKIEPILLTKVT